MTDVVTTALIASIAGGVLSLDRTAALQTMVSRPIVTAPVVGYLLGSVATGLVTGAVLELLLMGDLPVGAYVPMHETAIAAAVTALSVILSASTGLAAGHAAGLAELEAAATMLPVSLCLIFSVAFVYRRADSYTRKYNARFFHEAADALASGVDAHLVRTNLKGMVPAFVAAFAGLFITILPVGVIARLVLTHVPLGPIAGTSVMSAALAGCVLLAVGSAVTAVAGTVRSIMLFVVSSAGAGAVMVMMR